MDFAQLATDFSEKYFSKTDSSISKDLKLNFIKLASESVLEPKERYLVILSIAAALKFKEVGEFSVGILKELAVDAAEITEGAEVAGIMGMNNVYYKFRSFVAEESKPDYQRAGLRMQSMGNPKVGKKTFELLALAVSAINGCPVCVSSHEKSLRHLEVTPDQIHDTARLAAVIKGLKSLQEAQSFF